MNAAAPTADLGFAFRRRLAAGVRALALGLVLAARLSAQGLEADSLIVESLRLSDTDLALELQATSSGTLRLVGVQVDPDGSLVIQMPRHLPGAGVQDLFPASGLVSAVRVLSERTARGPLTRIVVSTRKEVAHSLSTEQHLLRLRLWPRGEEPPAAVAAGELRGQVDRLQAALAESERLRGVLARRAESLEGENQVLAQRFEALESRRGELDSAMKSTLGQATELLRSLAEEKESLGRQLAAVKGRESELQRQVDSLGVSLIESERGRQELTARLEELVGESAELARQVDAGKTREVELETALAQSRREIARLEREDAARAQAMAERLAAAGSREDGLRSQLESLASVLDEVGGDGSATAPAPGGEGPSAGTLTRVRTDDGYEGWVRSDEPAVAAAPPAVAEIGDEPAPGTESPASVEPATVAPPTETPAVTPPAVAPPAVAPPAADEPAARLTAVLGEQHALAQRLALVETERRALVAARGAEQAEVAVEGQPAGRTTGSLFLRRGPGTAFEALAVVPRGTEARAESRRGYWLRISGEGLAGWISGLYFDLDAGDAGLAAAIAAAAGRGASVEPAAAELIAEQQALVARLEGLEAQCRQLEAELADGSVRAVGQGRTTDRLHLRRGPGTAFEPITVLDRGAVVSVLSRGDLWHRVRAGADVGWVFSDFLSLEDGASGELQQPARLSLYPERGWTGGDVNVFSGPGDLYPAVAVLEAGVEVDVVDRREGWLEVQASGVEGWIRLDDLTLDRPGS